MDHMIHISPQSTGGDGTIRLQIGNKLNTNFGGANEISQLQIGNKLNTNWGFHALDSIFEPRDLGDGITPGSAGACSPSATANAPEKKLTLFALQLALLEKMATGFGALAFIWATVVLLGGYANAQTKTDFWFLTIILLIEGARILSRSHELEWQHQSTWTITDASIQSFQALKISSTSIVQAIGRIRKPTSEIPVRKLKEKTNETRPTRQLTRTYSFKEGRTCNQPRRTWSSSEVPLLPWSGVFFQSKNISNLLSWLQLLSALACIILSVIRLVQLTNPEAIDQTPETTNLRSSLNIFYGLALAEGFVSLLGKLYWEWMITFRKLLKEVNNECDLGSYGMISIRRFFYDTYAECINGSIFNGLRLDLVTFATELLASHSSDEQLIGAQILQRFSANPQFSGDTLQKIGTSTSVIARLVEMLNWNNPEEAEIRRAAAEILCILADKKQYSLRLAGISGAIESISSLLYTQRSCDCVFDELGEKQMVRDEGNYEYSAFSHLGLSILEKLARDNDNCEKIGNTRGLMLKIIDFTNTGELLLTNNSCTDNEILAVRKSLQILKLLARTSGNAGKHLRQEILDIVFTVSNIREILKHGEKYPKLQHIGIQILTSLAFDVEAREKIGSTGGITSELFRIFFREPNSEDQNNAKIAAGEAIAVLALESNTNCSRILNQIEIKRLVEALEDPALCIYSARILRHLCKFAGQDSYEKVKGVSAATSTVLMAIMSEENKPQEVMLGLATQVFRFMTTQEANIKFQQARIDEDTLARKLLDILKSHRYPSIKVPRMRRFAIELAILMMTNHKETIKTFRDLRMEKELEILKETTSEIECFNIFSGTTGLSRHTIPIHSLVDHALQLLADG